MRSAARAGANCDPDDDDRSAIGTGATQLTRTRRPVCAADNARRSAENTKINNKSGDEAALCYRLPTVSGQQAYAPRLVSIASF